MLTAAQIFAGNLVSLWMHAMGKVEQAARRWKVKLFFKLLFLSPQQQVFKCHWNMSLEEKGTCTVKDFFFSEGQNWSKTDTFTLKGSWVSWRCTVVLWGHTSLGRRNFKAAHYHFRRGEPAVVQKLCLWPENCQSDSWDRFGNVWSIEGPLSKACGFHVIRAGSWKNKSVFLPAARPVVGVMTNVLVPADVLSRRLSVWHQYTRCIFLSAAPAAACATKVCVLTPRLIFPRTITLDLCAWT